MLMLGIVHINDLIRVDPLPIHLLVMTFLIHRCFGVMIFTNLFSRLWFSFCELFALHPYN